MAFALDIPYAHPLGHRGLTHSLPFALLAGWLASRVGFGEARNVAWIAISASMASHGLLDALTNGGLGVGLLLPFSGERFFFGAFLVRFFFVTGAASRAAMSRESVRAIARLRRSA